MSESWNSIVESIWTKCKRRQLMTLSGLPSFMLVKPAGESYGAKRPGLRDTRTCFVEEGRF